jgi:hypothetical protein
MAVIHGNESPWLQELETKRARALDRVAVILVTTVICASVLSPAIGAVVLLAGLPAYLKHVRRWRYASDGAQGEWETAALLAGLPRTFTVFNDIALGGYNVDHVVVGPSGVWAIETKSQQGIVTESAEDVRIDGRPMYRDPRRQARGCAAEISKLIENAIGERYWVEALVCFPRATVLTSGSPAETSIVSRQHLVARLRWGSGRLAPGQCAHIRSALLAVQTAGSRLDNPTVAAQL